jgi:hypothetical protein
MPPQSAVTHVHVGIPLHSTSVVTILLPGDGVLHVPLQRAPRWLLDLSAQAPGLGLPQVQSFTRQSGGNVTIISEPGSGTTVQMFLPSTPLPAALKPTRGAEETASLRALRVLMVEDDPLVASVMPGFTNGFDLDEWARALHEADSTPPAPA